MMSIDSIILNRFHSTFHYLLANSLTGLTAKNDIKISYPRKMAPVSK